MIRVGIVGATGYTAAELIEILLRHDQVEITALTSRQEDEPHLTAVHPRFAGLLDLRLRQLDVATVAEQTDCVFCCLPHAASAPIVADFLDAGKRVVDFSADYRLADRERYETWYNVTHPDPGRLGQVAYGLPELFREHIVPAQLVANPGCFPTSAILGLAPLLQQPLIDPRSIIVDAKTGVSGAGRTPKLTTLFPECNESVAAYGVGKHRHMPEIDEILQRATGQPVEVIFTPHLIPMDRGILSTIYAVPLVEQSENAWLQRFRDFYSESPFVRVVEHLPSTKYTSGTNFCDMTVRIVRGRLVIMSAIDNLIKGASGAAVQNFNLMFGFPETSGLL